MYDIVELNLMIVSELRDVAQKLDIRGFRELKKQELIHKILDKQQAIKEQEGPTPAAPPATATAADADADAANRERRTRIRTRPEGPSGVQVNIPPGDEPASLEPAADNLRQRLARKVTREAALAEAFGAAENAHGVRLLRLCRIRAISCDEALRRQIASFKLRQQDFAPHAFSSGKIAYDWRAMRARQRDAHRIHA